MTTRALELSRAQILGFRRNIGALDDRMAFGPSSLCHASWAGLQDSMPRAALLSLHARVHGVMPNTWADPSLVQTWGPRFSSYVVAAEDIAIFTIGRNPDQPAARQRADDLADRLEQFLAGREMTYSEAGQALGENPNMLRYATTTGRVLIRWEGAGKPTIRTQPAPDVDPEKAKRELVRRFLRVFGPSTTDGFAKWAGVKPVSASATFDSLVGELMPVLTPLGEAFLLAEDEEGMRKNRETTNQVRLLPSGDTYYLLWSTARDLLVPDATRRSQLWTERVWPGAVFVNGEILGTWRRAKDKFTISMWDRVSSRVKDAIIQEVDLFPLSEIDGSASISWDD